MLYVEPPRRLANDRVAAIWVMGGGRRGVPLQVAPSAGHELLGLSQPDFGVLPNYFEQPVSSLRTRGFGLDKRLVYQT
jgi:hypothetical protein